MPTDPTAPPRPRLAAALVRLVGLWILAGALFKLLLGSPADLPPIVRELSPLGLLATYRAVIAVEVALATLAFVRPRWAWPVLALVLVGFDAILVGQIAAGAESCGCFGGDVPVPPWAMLAVDTALLVAMLAARPWRLGPGGPPLLLLPVGIVVGGLLPFLVDRSASPPPRGEDGAPAAARAADGDDDRFVVLDLESYEGRVVWDTELAQWIDGDPYALPGDGRWITWRWTCDHCAEHLAELARSGFDDPFLVLVRLEESHDTEANRAVFEMPEGPNVVHARLPPTVSWVTTTPGELVVEGGTVVSAEEGVE